MRILKAIFLSVLLVTSMGLIVSCGGNQSNGEGQDHDHSQMQHEQTIHGEGMEYTSKYVCPMHCEGSGGEEPGTCPVCGMDYVLLDEHVKDDHMH